MQKKNSLNEIGEFPHRERTGIGNKKTVAMHDDSGIDGENHKKANDRPDSDGTEIKSSKIPIKIEKFLPALRKKVQNSLWQKGTDISVGDFIRLALLEKELIKTNSDKQPREIRVVWTKEKE